MRAAFAKGEFFNAQIRGRFAYKKIHLNQPDAKGGLAAFYVANISTTQHKAGSKSPILGASHCRSSWSAWALPQAAQQPQLIRVPIHHLAQDLLGIGFRKLRRRQPLSVRYLRETLDGMDAGSPVTSGTTTQNVALQSVSKRIRSPVLSQGFG